MRQRLRGGQEALVATGETFGLQQAGKALGQAPNGFIAWLLDRGDIYRRAGSLCARQHLINRGVMTVKWEPYGGSPRPTTHVTGKGIALYAKILGVRRRSSRAKARCPAFEASP